MSTKLNKLKILDALKLVSSSVDIQIHDSVTSTNDFPGVVDQEADIKICLAEEQTKGRGRRGGEWVSPKGQNIYCSVQTKLNKLPQELSGLSLAIAVILVQAFEASGVRGIQVKWPNDLLFNGKKVGGILVETTPRSDHTIVNIGMGINVNMDLGADVSQAFTTLSQIAGQELDRNVIISNMLNQLISGLSVFEKSGLGAFQEAWQKYDFYHGKTIGITQNGETYHGEVLGINNLGQLMLETDSGVMVFTSVDASIEKNI